MKIENITPNVKQIYITQEKTDEDYGSCLWCKITFDLDSYTLLAESDCGNYTYGWTPTPKTESFIDLMCRIGKHYLLNKISDETEFDIEESKRKTIANLDDYLFQCVSEYQECINRINEIGNCEDELFYRECDDILGDYEICDSFEIIEIIKNYPTRAIRFVDIFKNIVQPFLKMERDNND